MINLTGIVPEDFFSGDWMVTSLPSLTLKQKNLISGILEKLLTESSNFKKEQVDVIKEYWDSVTDDDDEEVILCAAYRAGLYSTEHTEEDLLLHACKIVAYFLGDGDGSSEEFLFEGKLNHFLMLIKEAEWLLAADVVSKEVYSRIIMRMLSENHDLAGLLEDVLGFEVGLSDETFFSQLNEIGDAVVGRLLGLDCVIYPELPKKEEAKVSKKKEEEHEMKMNEYYEKEKTNKGSMADDEDEAILCAALRVSAGKEYDATFRKEEEEEKVEEEESLTLSHLLNDNGNGGDHVDLATLGERECKGDTCGFESNRTVLSSRRLKESVFQLPDQSNNKKKSMSKIGVDVASVFIAVASVFEMIMGLIPTASKVFGGKGNRRTARSGSRNRLDRTDYIAARTIYSLLIFLAVSSDPFVDAGTDFVWKPGYKDNYAYKDYCIVSDDNAFNSCVCLHGSSYIRPPSGDDGSSGYSFYQCTEDCHDQYPRNAYGYCGQCPAGTFFGAYKALGYETGAAACSGPNPFNLSPICECTITTYSQQNAQPKFFFSFVCSHNAQQSSSPNDVIYIDNDCEECPAGTYSNQGDMVCTACPVGNYTNTAGTKKSCNPCPVGTYTDKTGTTECTPCPAGTYNENEGSTEEVECLKCQPGYYSSSPGSKVCTRCGAGTYTDSLGATSCKQAEPGYFVGATKFEPQTAQYPCPVGSYTDTPGQYLCVSCLDGYSTTGIASTKSSDCIMCEYGVDPYNFTCLTASEAANLNDLCWNPSELLSLNGSSAVNDLLNLVYDLADVGINSLINDAMSVIQGVANGTRTIQDIQNVLSKLENGPTNWLKEVSSNMDFCVGTVSQQLSNQAQSDLYANTNMFQYQFGDNYAENRMEWIARWKCSGATFGCMPGSSSNCPQAESCFSPLYQYYAALLSFPGGPPFGNNLHLHLSTGRYTPKYSPDFIASELMDNVKSLVDWESTAESFLHYYDVIQQIEASEEATVNFIANVVDVTLQVENVSTSVSLNASYTQGNLYYQQSEYNYNKTYNYSEIVQWGPAYCPSGYEITADGIPDECTNYTVLVQKCQKEIKFDSFMSLITATMNLAAAIVDPFTAGTTAEKFAKAFSLIGQISTNAETFSQQYYVKDTYWDPSTTLPPLPDMDAYGAFENETYADGSYQWYLSAQQNVSKALVNMSQAQWESIYLENEQTFAPTLLDPPSCSSWADDILAALTDYLANVKNMANYGSAMTSAAMNLDPTLGNIAVKIATQEAIASANQEINGMVNKPDPSIETAPSSYQSVYGDIFYSTYTNESKAILAHSAASSLAQKQYIAAKSINGFCVSYSYTNAGNLYGDTNPNEKTANCQDFGNLYLPTYETFQDTVSSFVEGTSTSIVNPPSSVDQLNKNIMDFSENIQSNPEVFGQTRQDITGPQAIAIEFPLGINAMTYCEDGNTTSVPPFSPPQVYVDLTNRIVRFSLTASSDLWQQSLTPFVLEDSNPLAINVQTYLKGVISPNGQFIEISVDPISPYFVYQDDSGVGIPYTLSPYKGSSGSASFATFNSIQVPGTCPGTDDTLVPTKWMGDEQLSFCTDYSSDLQAPFEGIAEYDFLFPSLFTTWELQMNTNICNPDFYTIVNETLVLQVVFQYIASTSPSPADPNTCYQDCYKYNGVLPGQLWCDQPKCGDCPASLSYNGTNLTNGTEFCRCNVWNGENGICTPTLGLSNTYVVSLSGSRSRRNLRKNHNKKGSDVKGTKSDKDNGAKSGKSMSDEEMMTSLNLQVALQTHLEECSGGDNLLTSQVLVEVTECYHQKKNDHKCEFHVKFNDYVGDDSKKALLDECIGEKLQDGEILNAILQQTSSCGIRIKNESREVELVHHDGCDDSSEASIFERV